MKQLLGFSLAIVLFSFSGCDMTNYVATSNYAPNLRRAGDYEVSAGTKSRIIPPLPGLELNAAFSPLPHIGILASYRRDFRTRYLGNISLEQELGEIGIGSYQTLKKQFGFALYGGYSAGALQRRVGNEALPNKQWTDDLNIRFHRYWLMAYATLLQGAAQNVELGLGMKVSRQVFDQYSSANGLPTQVDYVGQGFNSVEPFLYGRIGEQAHQFHVQMGVSFPQNKNFAAPAYGHLSIQYVFARPFRKQKKQALEAGKQTP